MYSDVSLDIMKKVNAAKEIEIEEALKSRKTWEKSIIIFETLTYVTAASGIILGMAAAIFTNNYQNLLYASNVTGALATTCKGLSAWSSKKFTNQAIIVNSMIDSIKSSHIPIIETTSPSKDEISVPIIGEEVKSKQ